MFLLNIYVVSFFLTSENLCGYYRGYHYRKICTQCYLKKNINKNDQRPKFLFFLIKKTKHQTYEKFFRFNKTKRQTYEKFFRLNKTKHQTYEKFYSKKRTKELIITRTLLEKKLISS